MGTTRIGLSGAILPDSILVGKTNGKAQNNGLSLTNYDSESLQGIANLAVVLGKQGDKEQESREGIGIKGRGSAAYPLLVVEGADGDLLFLTASGAPTV